MQFNLEAITQKFSSSLYWLYEDSLKKLNEKGTYKPPSWLKTYLVFCALESVRRNLQVDEKYLYCRFSLGRRKRSEQHLHKEISEWRLYNPRVRDCPKMLSEHLVDFSISKASLPQGQGVVELDKDIRYKMILASESELVPNLAMVREDCLKLVDTAAPLKILLFPSNKNDWAVKRRTDAIERILNNNESRSLHENVDWLFLSIPLFRNWMDVDDDMRCLNPRVYILRFSDRNPIDKQYSLDEQKDWWIKGKKQIQPPLS